MELAALGFAFLFILATFWGYGAHVAHHRAVAHRVEDRDFYRAEITRLNGELDNERDRHNVTRERLFMAWKEGAKIPPAPEEPEEELALPDELEPIWNDWEGAGKQKMKAILREQIAKGRSVPSLLEEYGFTPPKE